MPVVDFLLSRLGERYDLATATGKREAVQDAMGVLRDLTDPVEREHYLQRLANIVGLDESGLRAALRRVGRRSITAAPASPESSHDLPEAYALALVFLVRGEGVLLPVEDIPSPEGRAIFSLIKSVSPTERDSSTFNALADSADPSLRGSLTEVASWIPRLIDLTPEQLAREFEIVSLKLKQQQLRLRHQEVLLLLSESASGLEEAAPAKMLSTIAGQLREIEAALARRAGIGSLVWRSRQIGEVLGG